MKFGACPTTQAMQLLETAKKLNLNVIGVLEDESWRGKITVKSGGKVKFTANDWKVMEKTVEVLKPFKDATVKLSS